MPALNFHDLSDQTRNQLYAAYGVRNLDAELKDPNSPVAKAVFTAQLVAASELSVQKEALRLQQEITRLEDQLRVLEKEEEEEEKQTLDKNKPDQAIEAEQELKQTRLKEQAALESLKTQMEEIIQQSIHYTGKLHELQSTYKETLGEKRQELRSSNALTVKAILKQEGVNLSDEQAQQVAQNIQNIAQARYEEGAEERLQKEVERVAPGALPQVSPEEPAQAKEQAKENVAKAIGNKMDVDMQIKMVGELRDVGIAAAKAMRLVNSLFPLMAQFGQQYDGYRMQVLDSLFARIMTLTQEGKELQAMQRAFETKVFSATVDKSVAMLQNIANGFAAFKRMMGGNYPSSPFNMHNGPGVGTCRQEAEEERTLTNSIKNTVRLVK